MKDYSPDVAQQEVVIPRPALPVAPRIDEGRLMEVLQSSLYPGAAPASISLAIGYCKASGLDPMLKPVHLVPLWDSKAGRMRDIVMPGIGLYRIVASRTGEHAGTSEPEFGPDKTKSLGGVEVTYPSWCRVTVSRRLSTGVVAHFTALEYWEENYAVKGGKERSVAPNAMWQKRAYAQLAKCAEAQALRKGFPEVGSQPTADEMEGKAIDVVEAGGAVGVSDAPSQQRQQQPMPGGMPPEVLERNMASWNEAIKAGKYTSERVLAQARSRWALTPEQEAAIRGLPYIEEGAKDSGRDAAQAATQVATPEEMDVMRLLVIINRAQNIADLAPVLNEIQNSHPAYSSENRNLLMKAYDEKYGDLPPF